ncbi:hypothetical protein LXL04_038736 [Taraxacum kok-saghyz]
MTYRSNFSFAKFQLPRRLFTGDDLRCEGEALPECYLDRLFTGGDLLHQPFSALFDDLDFGEASTSLRPFWPPLLSDFGRRHRLFSFSSIPKHFDGNVVIKFDDKNGFQKFEKIKNSSRQSRQLEELIGKMRECKRLIKEFDREVKDLKHTVGPDTNKILNEKKQSMDDNINICDFYLGQRVELMLHLKSSKYASNIENKRVDLFGGPGEGFEEDNGLLASSMTNQQLEDNCHHMMDETDQTIERSEKVVHETVTVGTETAATLKAQVASLLHDDVLDDVDTRCDIANSDRGRASSCWENNANEHHGLLFAEDVFLALQRFACWHTIYACSHLFWVDDQDGIKDGERVLLCLKHALRIANPAQQMANVARGSSEPVTLFDEILNKEHIDHKWSNPRADRADQNRNAN